MRRVGLNASAKKNVPSLAEQAGLGDLLECRRPVAPPASV